jgi:hypothetical protein
METPAVTHILRLPASYAIIGFVVGHLFALGMRLTVQEIIAPLRRRLVVLAVVANFVLGPIFAYLSAQLISVRNIEAVLLIASTSVADPKVMVMAVIAALVILIVLLGTTAVFEHRSRPAGQEALSR